MLIGSFWTRLGSPTGIEDSGTVEEIKHFLKANKPVMLYYSKRPVDPDFIDTAQMEKLKAFRASIRDKGVQEQYSSVVELKQKLSRQLTIIMRGMSVGTVVDKQVVQEARKSGQEPLPPSPQKARRAPTLIEQTERSFIIKGRTSLPANELEAMGGQYITLKGGAKAWNFSKKRLNEVAAALGIEAKLVTSG